MKKSVYFYRNICILPYKNGYMIDNDLNIYKTIDDCKNAIDNKYGLKNTIIPKRYDKPIKIIGQFISD